MAEVDPGTEDQGRPEIVLAIVSPIGSDVATISDVLAESLQQLVGYQTTIVRVSELIETATPELSEPPRSLNPAGDNRFRQLMDRGDQLRTLTHDGAFCAMLAVQAIRQVRADQTGDEMVQRKSGATIVRSLKHPAEVALLRQVYGQRLTVIGISEERAVREARLRSQLATEMRQGKTTVEVESQAAGEAAALVMRDEKDEDSEPFRATC